MSTGRTGSWSVRLAGPWTHRAVSANGNRLHVVECGEGPLVVLLHGFPEFWWSWLIRALGEPRAHLVGHDWGGLIGWTVAALHPRSVRSLAVVGAPHPLAVRAAMVGDARAARAGRQRAMRWASSCPARSLRVEGGARVERLMRAWAGRAWASTGDFAEVVEQYRRAIQVPGVAHSAME